MTWRRAASSAVLLATFGLACNRERTDVREWRPSDHDHTSSPNAAQAGAEPSPAVAAAANHGVDQVTLIAWKQNCITCHGVVGAGDGPQGAALRPTDLTKPAWQASITDEQIAATIRAGKGAMPAFPLPDSTVTGLVRLVRLLRTGPAPEAGAGTAPTDSGAPSPSTADAPVPSR
jgi:mono/diheme cytochrome c family protein